MTTMFKKIGKMLGGASTLAALAAAALLSVMLGCGGSVTGDQAPGNAVTIDLVGAAVVTPPDSVSTVGFTMSNVSGSAVTSVIYYNNGGTAVTQTMTPPVASGHSIAAVARVRVSQVTNTDNGVTTTSYQSSTNSISMVVTLANGSNKAITIGISIDPDTGDLTLTNATATVDITN